MANTLNLFRNRAVGFIDWLDLISADEKNELLKVIPAMALLDHRLQRRRRKVRGTNRLSDELRSRAIRWPLSRHADAR